MDLPLLFWTAPERRPLLFRHNWDKDDPQFSAMLDRESHQQLFALIHWKIHRTHLCHSTVYDEKLMPHIPENFSREGICKRCGRRNPAAITVIKTVSANKKKLCTRIHSCKFFAKILCKLCRQQDVLGKNSYPLSHPPSFIPLQVNHNHIPVWCL